MRQDKLSAPHQVVCLPGQSNYSKSTSLVYKLVHFTQCTSSSTSLGQNHHTWLLSQRPSPVHLQSFCTPRQDWASFLVSQAADAESSGLHKTLSSLKLSAEKAASESRHASQQLAVAQADLRATRHQLKVLQQQVTSQTWSGVLLCDTQSLMIRRPHHDVHNTSAWKVKAVVACT